MPVSDNTRLGVVHLYALEGYPEEDTDDERLESVQWYITHYDGERFTVFQLIVQPRDEQEPAHWAVSSYQTPEIEELEDRIVMAVELGTRVSREMVEHGVATTRGRGDLTSRRALANKRIPMDWAFAAASAIHMNITRVPVTNTLPWWRSLREYWDLAVNRFMQNMDAVHFSSWPLPGPVRINPDGSTVWEYPDSDGGVVEWDRPANFRFL